MASNVVKVIAADGIPLPIATGQALNNIDIPPPSFIVRRSHLDWYTRPPLILADSYIVFMVSIGNATVQKAIPAHDADKSFIVSEVELDGDMFSLR